MLAVKRRSMLKTRRTRALAAVLFLVSLGAAAQAAPIPEGHDQMLRQLISEAAQGRINYQTLSPDLAEAVRGQAVIAQSEISALGALKSITLQVTDKSGMEIYRTVFEKGVLEWAFHVGDRGLIDNANYRVPKTEAP
jgi:hypothetical protein